MAKKINRRITKPPALTRSDDLCKRLAGIAAFNLTGQPEAQAAIYKAIKQLQLLDAEAVKAGILPPA